MVQIVCFAIGIFVLCIASPVTGDIRAATAEVVTVSGALNVEVDAAMASEIANKLAQDYKNTAQAVTEYARAFADVKSSEHKNSGVPKANKDIALNKLEEVPPAMRLAASEYAQAYADCEVCKINNLADTKAKREVAFKKLEHVATDILNEAMGYAQAFAEFKLSEINNPVNSKTMEDIASQKLGIVPSDMQNTVKEYAQAFADSKIAEEKNSAEIEDKKYLAARKLADMGFIVFVSGGPRNYILVPATLQRYFSLQNLIRYIFAVLQLNELSKDIEDAQVKQITEVDEKERIFYTALEFTSSKPFGSAILTLGSVHSGKFYLESEKIEKHDQASNSNARLVKKNLLDLLNEYNNTTFAPIYVKALKIGRKEPWVLAVKGIIRDISLKFIVEGTLASGKKNLEEIIYKAEAMRTSKKTLEGYIAALEERNTKPEYTHTKFKIASAESE